MNEPLPVVASRVILRRLRPTDLANFQAYRHDKEVGRYQGWLPQLDTEARNFLNTMQHVSLLSPGLWTQLGIADRYTDELIGDIGICVLPDQKSAEIGFTLRAASQGQGLASEAVQAAIGYVFANTNVEWVLGMADVRNHASLRLLQRVGMKKISSEYMMIRDQQCLVDVYGLMRPSDTIEI